MTLINRHRTGLPLGVVCLRAISEPSDVSAIPSATAQAGTYLIVKTNSSTKQECSDCNVGLSIEGAAAESEAMIVTKDSN
jgi:hypothetical protein